MLRKVEIILCVAVAVAVLLRMALVSGSTSFLITMLMTLTFVYFYLGFLLFTGVSFKGMFRKASYEGIAGSRIAGAVFSGFALATVCVGVLFKLLSWPGSAIDLAVGLVLCAVILVISFMKIGGKYSGYYKPLVVRMLIACVLSAGLLSMPQKAYLEFMQRDNPAYVRAVEEMWKDPTNATLMKRVREEQKIMHHH